MRFGILGPLEVAENGGRRLELGGRRQRAVLAILLLHSNEVVSSDRLVEDLWSGQPPASAAASLHAHVSRLRRALGDDQRIITTGGGYLIRVAPGELDRDRFERLVEEGGAAVAAEYWEVAYEKLHEALGLWRGAPLSDFAYESFAQSEISRLEEMRLAALEDRIDAELALGGGAALVGELEGLAREHPYRERLRGQLMLALYRAGRQTDALATYRELSGVLRDELGLEPGESLRELERAILRHDPSLSTSAAAQWSENADPATRAAALPAGTVTFLFTDIEGSTRLLRELGSERYSEELGRHRDLVRRAVAARGGRELGTEGDAFFVAFARASDALGTANEVQAALRDGPVRVRMGVHTGEPLLVAGNYVGLDVHKAARICAVAHGGQVLVSRATRDLAGRELRDLGLHRLKDLAAPERLFQLGAGDFPPLRTPAIDPGRLPLRGSRVLGRERELAELEALLADPGVALLTLTGPGGSGKTTLGLEAARRAGASFSDGITVVWLAGVSDALQVVPELARVLGVEVSSQEPAIETLARVLRFQQRLLVLDNFEHLIAAAPVLAQLVGDCSQLKLLVTSRAPLRVNLERVYRVDGLAAPESVEGTSLDSLARWPASALFIERARAANPECELEQTDCAAVAELCSYLGGLPLALELAAAATALLSPGEILDHLRSSSRPLGPPRRDAPDRHQTIRATIDWSLNLLAVDEQRLFGRLGVFVGGFTIEAARAVCEDLGQSVVEGLAILLDHGLIYRQLSGPQSRLRMLEPIRDDARERLNADPERERAIRRHAEHYVTLAEAAEVELTSGDQLRCLERLDEDQANIRAALDRAKAQPEIDTALRIASALADYLFIRGLVAERRPWLAWALGQPLGEPAIRARALSTLGMLADEDGEYAQASSALKECLAVCKQLDNPSLTADCEAHIAVNEWYLGNGESSARYAERALTTAARADDPHAEAIVLLLTAYCAQNYQDARKRSQRALEMLESLGDKIWPPRIKANLAKQARLAGDHEYARLLIGQAIAHPDPIWGAGLRAQNERELGMVELSQGRHIQAREHLRRSVALGRSIGDRRDSRDALIGLAALEVAEQAPERAGTLFAAALSLLDAPLDVQATLQGCRLTEKHAKELAGVADHAASALPLTAGRLEAILRDASENPQARAEELITGDRTPSVM